ncbi:hypothetical protein M885DRAFT_626865 [Pelagophyceae sp. CCMP2097]|nr:hypothetical protein M885DRAFT_626865 [Pelagophyceae sp. CCMP2097]|mmetsp:Transcript_242/g.880  ORF Transcript_242/g.880 Transcript_242/m.880 type:complete len:186 (+) Transcript_242:178-735(+)
MASASQGVAITAPPETGLLGAAPTARVPLEIELDILGLIRVVVESPATPVTPKLKPLRLLASARPSPSPLTFSPVAWDDGCSDDDSRALAEENRLLSAQNRLLWKELELSRLETASAHKLANEWRENHAALDSEAAALRQANASLEDRLATVRGMVWAEALAARSAPDDPPAGRVYMRAACGLAE